MSQARESADAERGLLQAGAEFSAFNPDFYCSSSSPFTCGNGFPLLKGVGVFATYNMTQRLGAEAEARWLQWDGVDGQVESNYLVGPRFRAYRWNRFGLWAKFLLGSGLITTEHYPDPNTLKGSFFVYAPGGTLEFRLNRRFTARGDYELQKWPGFAVLPPHNHGLTPTGFSFGVAYRIRH